MEHGQKMLILWLVDYYGVRDVINAVAAAVEFNLELGNAVYLQPNDEALSEEDAKTVAVNLRNDLY